MRRPLILAALCLAAAGAFGWFALRGGDEAWPEVERMNVITGQSIGYVPIHDQQTRYMLYFKFQDSDRRIHESASIARSPVERGRPVIILYDAADPARHCWASPSDADPAKAEYASMRESQLDSSRNGRILLAGFTVLLLAIAVYFGARLIGARCFEPKTASAS